MNEGLIKLNLKVHGTGCDVKVSRRGEFLAIESAEAVYIKMDDILSVLVGGEEPSPVRKGDSWDSVGRAPVSVVTKRSIAYVLYCEGSAAAAHVSLKIIEALMPRDPGVEERTANLYKNRPSRRHLKSGIDSLTDED